MDEQLSCDLGEIESKHKHHIISNSKYRLRKINIWDMLFLLYGIRRKYKHTVCMARANYLHAMNRSWLK